jgi:hypothetical protein
MGLAESFAWVGKFFLCIAFFHLMSWVTSWHTSLKKWNIALPCNPVTTHSHPAPDQRLKRTQQHPLDGCRVGKRYIPAYSDQQLSTHAATDDRYANFSASTCPAQPPQLIASSTADKLPLEKFHRLLDLVF